MLSTQDVLNIQDTQRVLPDESEATSANMDCEGFQDLRNWCSTPVAGGNKQSLIDKEDGLYYENSEEKYMPVIQDGPFFWADMMEVSVPLSSLDRNPEIQYQTLPAIPEDRNLNTPPESVTECLDFNNRSFEVIDSPVTLDDMPAYEETIEIETQNNDITIEYIDHPSYYSDENNKWESPTDENHQVYEDSNSCVYGMKSYDNDVMLSLGVGDALKKPSVTVCNNSYSDNINKMSNMDLPADATSVNFNFALSTNIKQNNDMVIENIILDSPSYRKEMPKIATIVPQVPGVAMKDLKLDLNLGYPGIPNSAFIEEISTPDVLMAVEQLENDSKYNFKRFANDHPVISCPMTSEICVKEEESYSLTPPDTPKYSTRKRRRSSSEDSDASYVPPSVTHKKPRKASTQRSKDILQIISTPVRRGRPPKHRDSVSSNGTNYTDDRSAASSPCDKYRERRDKNNEASRRSRYNRKLKDSEMSTIADDLEARNSELKVTVANLENKKKRLRDILLKFVSNGQT